MEFNKQIKYTNCNTKPDTIKLNTLVKLNLLEN